ncbi:MAG: hypothetical protein WDW36_010128 [Sanguina aurantia]
MVAAGGGGLISQKPAAYSGDGKFVICPCGRKLNVYSAVTGELVGHLRGHTAEVTAVVLNPHDKSQVYSASLDGTLRLWDFSTSSCLQVLPVNEAVHSLVIHEKHNVAYLSVDMKEKGGRVLAYSLSQGRSGVTAMKTRSPTPLALGSSGAFAATIDRHSLYVFRAGVDVTQPLNLHHTQPYTCLAISPDDSIIAAGDSSGRILLWRNFAPLVPTPCTRREQLAASQSGQKQAPPPATTLHWHSHAVGCLAFSADGAFLMSGGVEGVFVVWRMDTGVPTFLPRLGGPLLGVSANPADPAKYLVRQADNTLRIINTATLKVGAVGGSPASSACGWPDPMTTVDLR